jgi:hypothetical protein
MKPIRTITGLTRLRRRLVLDRSPVHSVHASAAHDRRQRRRHRCPEPSIGQQPHAEPGFAPPLARGLFVLSRNIGILAHAWEETQQGQRIKGPMPPSILPTYRG